MSGGFQEAENGCQVPVAAEMELGRGPGSLDQCFGHPSLSTAVRAPWWSIATFISHWIPALRQVNLGNQFHRGLSSPHQGGSGTGEKPQGMGLASQSVQPENDLDPLPPPVVVHEGNKDPAEQLTQSVSSPGATWPRGLLAPWEKVAVHPSWVFVLF